MEIPTPVCALVRNDNVVRGARSPLQIPIWRTEERYRAAQGRNDYTYLAHDLAARPAGKFQFIRLPNIVDLSDCHLSVSYHKNPLLTSVPPGGILNATEQESSGRGEIPHRR